MDSLMVLGNIALATGLSALVSSIHVYMVHFFDISPLGLKAKIWTQSLETLTLTMLVACWLSSLLTLGVGLGLMIGKLLV